MARLLVSVGTDNFTDWVQLPDGQKMNLGKLSVLTFVAHTIADSRKARRVLNTFIENGEAILSVDEERMWKILTPVRVRVGRAHDSSFAAHSMRTNMIQDLKKLETHIAALNAATGKVTPEKMAEGLQILTKLANFPVPKELQASHFNDSGSANQVLAKSILAKAEETTAKIAKIASKPGFNAAKARADVHEVTSRVASALRQEAPEAQIRGELTKLAARNNEISALFAKV